jgi:hypothetical protein
MTIAEEGAHSMTEIKRTEIKRSPKQRLAPYRLFVGILFMSSDGIYKGEEPNTYFISTGPLSRKLAMTYKEFWAHLKFLETNNYLKIHERYHGEALLKIEVPPLFSQAVKQNEASDD